MSHKGMASINPIFPFIPAISLGPGQLTGWTAPPAEPVSFQFLLNLQQRPNNKTFIFIQTLLYNIGPLLAPV